MKVKELLERLSKASPEAEVSLVDSDFSSYEIEESESFGITDAEVTIYICE